MFLFEGLRRIFAGEDKQTSHQSIGTSQPTPTYGFHPFNNNELERSLSKPSSSSSTTSFPSSKSNPSSSSLTSNCTAISSLPSSNPSLLPSSSKPSFSSSKPFSSNASPSHFSIPSSNASSAQNPSLPSSKIRSASICKDLEETIKEASVPLVSSRPKSPSKASPRETLSFSSKLADQRYDIPKLLEEEIEKDIGPDELRRPLSPSTYSDYFSALLYAEDFYIEKWSKFLLSGVTLELRRRKPTETISPGNLQNEKKFKDLKPFVAFEIDKIPERRPYLLSRDFVFARQSTKTAKPFKGVIFRVVKSTTVLVEFGDDFHSQHSLSNKYDMSFSFNRVCLKRSHQGMISAAKDSSFHDVLFPNLSSTSRAIQLYRNYDHCQLSTSNRILNHKGPLPYLIEGPLSTTLDKLSRTGTVIQEAVLKIYATNPQCRILICSPTNFTCDALMRGLLEQIPKEKLFRQSLYKERFARPSQFVLQTFSVITSTYVTSFRLCTAGLGAEHFTHIFLVDASSTTEPEVVVPLANFLGKSTIIVATGSLRNSPSWVRSDIARKYGLKRSYFQRLIEEEPYASRNPVFISHVK